MPAYDFKCNTCERVFEQRHPITRIPDRITCPDASCTGKATRQLSIGSLVDAKPCSSKYPYVSDRLPRNAKGCMTDSQGKPVIMSRMHEDRVFKELGYERE